MPENYHREHPEFALCGLNCVLCPMHLGGYCPGCGGGAGNQPCKRTRCARERGGIEFCWLCGEYPCKRYDGAAQYDSFLTHQAMFRDAARAREEGLAAYLKEVAERERLLHRLLDGCNDGRRKTLFCTAAALLSLPALREAVEGAEEARELPLKERAAAAARLLQDAAEREGVSLKLRKKPKEK